MEPRTLWGEMEEEVENDETVLQNVNFHPIIELGMQNIPEIPITVKTSPIELPKPNLITHTVQLHVYERQLTNLLEQGDTTLIESVPEIPPEPETKVFHTFTQPIVFMPKKYCAFSHGNGPLIQPFAPESHKRALKQCAALALGHVGILSSTNAALNALTDLLDIYMTNMCKLLRSAVDNEASGIKSGFPDAICKVFTDLNVGNLQNFYEYRIVQYHKSLKQRCLTLREQCEAAMREIPPQLKLEEVPELHFPTVLSGTFTPSLEPGFQMLQSLEQEQLQGLDLLEGIPSDSLDNLEFPQVDRTNQQSMSPNAKKKRKINT